MKYLAILLLSVCGALAQTAATNQVLFSFQDAFGRPQAYRRFTLQPVPNLYPATNNIGQVTGDFMATNTDAVGNASISNVVAGTYAEAIYGPTGVTTNYLIIPAATGTIFAKNCLTVYPSGIGFLLYDEAGVTGGRLIFEP